MLELAGYSAESLGAEARRALAASLYAHRVLTLAQVTHLAEMPACEFIPFLASIGLPAVSYPSGEINYNIIFILLQI